MKKLFLIAVLSVFFVSCNEEKTAYVDTTKLIQEYQEMKDVEAEFSKKSDIVKGELDSVASAFQAEVQEYQSQMNSMSQAQRQEREQELMQKQQQLQQQQQQRGGVLRQESDAAIDSIVEKVKNYVEEYGKENGYTYIFGSNESASIMYAKDGLDITEEILEELNASYKKD
ncbi:MAG: OmpH family outer membrane protein [Salegentibacter sp.]|uniref:OmpH family outer membrane protein n=1 Tax=Salegentibacter sp. TaxID=1903072 RepID=UPI002870922D|nr:OmpH family outer membrane protein [Salegentibacter sp.]MDR9458094.1 OmpH family outer membrane protein [Salegentibacter sp.]